MERTRSELTAIALQEHAAWESACRRCGYEILDPANHPLGLKWLAKEQEHVADLYDIARFHAYVYHRELELQS